ncbi:hypothetical protein OS493_026811 [Desmophyllum pertusum]|uniref:Uncharacterized protein n=1 Tax=Desmophyllum pertusum TaxID=174260 RepID=A0A9X0D1P5_9CNID|nr:hypothetical protein OS493_026811 [Desmophyllum pertusum]
MPSAFFCEHVEKHDHNVKKKLHDLALPFAFVLYCNLLFLLLSFSFQYHHHRCNMVSGVICTWSDGSLEVDLHHCKKPIKYHVYINAPGYAVKNLTLGKGEDKTLYRGKILTLKLKVTELKRQENIVTTTVEIETCTTIVGCNKAPLLNQQKFCVRMQNCPGYNASAVHYKPCGLCLQARHLQAVSQPSPLLWEAVLQTVPQPSPRLWEAVPQAIPQVMYNPILQEVLLQILQAAVLMLTRDTARIHLCPLVPSSVSALLPSLLS